MRQVGQNIYLSGVWWEGLWQVPFFRWGSLKKGQIGETDTRPKYNPMSSVLSKKPDLSDSLCYDVMIAHENTSTRWQVSKEENQFPDLLRIFAMLWDASTVHITQKIFSYEAITVPRCSLYFPGLPFDCCPIQRLISSQLPLTAVWFDSHHAHGLYEKCSVTMRCYYRCSSFLKGKLRLREVAVLRSHI